MKMKRYTATYTMYIYATSDEHARSKAKMIEKRENYKFPMQDCRLEQLDATPFASLLSREIPLEDSIPEDLPF